MVPEGFVVELVQEAPELRWPSAVHCLSDGSLLVAEDPMDMPGPADRPIDRILRYRWLADGSFERTVFCEGLYAVFGLQKIDGAVYVMNMPHLTVLRDADGDGAAEERRELLEEDGQPTLTRTGEALGTPAYMSPEQLGAANGFVDRRTDVWSIGVTLYEGLTGKRPFDAPTREGIVRAILEEEPAPVRPDRGGRARDLEVVVATALSKELGRRYRTALDLAEDLRRVRAREPIRARPMHAGQKLARWCRRNPALALATGLLFLVLSAGLAVSSSLLASARRSSRSKDNLIADFTRLSDLKLVSELMDAEAGLWPPAPERAADLRAWLRRSGEVLAREPVHRASLATLEAAIAAGGGLPAGTDETGVTAQRMREQLVELRGATAALRASAARVERRLAFAESVE